MDRTPSEWEREFQAQQSAAMSEVPASSAADVNRTPSDWLKAFEKEREQVMGSADGEADGEESVSKPKADMPTSA